MNANEIPKPRCTIDLGLVDHPAGYLPPPPLPEGGGEAVFLGRTRAETHPELGRLVALEYEAYESMVIRRMRDLAQSAAGQFGARHISIRHAVGRVPVGGASVVIQVLCPHRAQAFDACRFLIDQLKVDVPIWKREIHERGESTWKEGSPVPQREPVE